MYKEKYSPFFEKPNFSVIKTGIQDELKYPKVRFEVGLIDIIPLRLMSEGVMGGDYMKILDTPIDVIMNIWNYINFKQECVLIHI